ncbi:DUF3761 domain-containing protein [Sphingomonas sp. SUN039]|uniref:DUF3761 domain-containing protein n=1 Tax=Sphingomonas sp. SUN039 TaxID=2937787 RepID=UPI0038D466C3
MRKVLAIAMALALLAPSTGIARRTHHTTQSYPNTYGSEYYTARSGHRVHRPVRANRAPAGASAQCRDGTWSFSESHRGTCSHHGGVSRWL